MGNDGLPEAVLNAGGSVWDIDTLVRPGSRNLSSISGGREGSGGAGNDWDMCLAVATGPLRQTDEPLDEVRKSDYRESRWRCLIKIGDICLPSPRYQKRGVLSSVWNYVGIAASGDVIFSSPGYCEICF